MITITDNAKTQLTKIYTENPGKRLRVAVISGGCSGFMYHMDLINPQECNDDDEFIFDNDIEIIVDGYSMMLLDESELDYESSLSGSKFVFANPNKRSSCGCEKSFSV